MARIFLERFDMADDLKRILHLLDQGGEAACECTLPCDVIETTSSIDVVMDAPGVSADSLNIVFARNTLVIAGLKRPAACEHPDAAFHLAERTFGRFARAIRVTGAFDAGAARATLVAGELRVVLPRITERRGGEIRIPVQDN